MGEIEAPPYSKEGSGWLRERVDIKGLKRLLLCQNREKNKGVGEVYKEQRYRALSPLYLHISMFLYFLQIAGQARNEGCTLSPPSERSGEA